MAKNAVKTASSAKLDRDPRSMLSELLRVAIISGSREVLRQILRTLRVLVRALEALLGE